ncbi:MAG: hypothetical protein ABF296_03345 [Oceanococcaceae bacterium]
MKVNKGHHFAMVAAAMLAGVPVLHSFNTAHAQGSTTADAAQVLTPAQASQVASELGISVEEAVDEGLLLLDPASGTYTVTESGAAAFLKGQGVGGLDLIAGLTQAELTSLVLGVLGLAIVVSSDEDPRGGAVTPTPTVTVTPTPTVTVTPTPTATVTPTPTEDPNAGTTTTSTTDEQITPTPTAAPPVTVTPEPTLAPSPTITQIPPVTLEPTPTPTGDPNGGTTTTTTSTSTGTSTSSSR